MKVLSQKSLHVNPNLLINGCMSQNQRGVSSWTPDSNKYSIDRWRLMGGFSGCTQGPHANASVGNVSRYVMSLTKSANGFVDQTIHNGMSKILGADVTLSFVCSSDTFFTGAQIVNAGISEVFGSFFDNFSITQHESNPTWYRFKATAKVTDAPVDISSEHLVLRIIADGAAASSWISEVKLEYGTEVTPFVTDDYGINLAKCQYYFERITDTAGTNGQVPICMGTYGTATFVTGHLPFKTKRVPPTISASSQTGFKVYGNSAEKSTSAVSFTTVQKSSAYISCTTLANTQGVGAKIFTAVGVNSYIDIDAEI